MSTEKIVDASPTKEFFIYMITRDIQTNAAIVELVDNAIDGAKRLRKPKSWCKSVSAFANTFGGSLIFGVSNDGEIVGLQDPDGDAEKISEIIKTRLDPIPEYRLRFHDEAGKILVILDVVKGEETPYYYSGDGVLEA